MLSMPQRRGWFLILCGLVAVVLSACDSVEPQPRSAAGDRADATNPTPAQLDIWWPTDGSWVSGKQPFKARLVDWKLGDYRMYWQVDGGQLNLMSDSYQDAPHKESVVDLQGWTWRGSGPYLVNFVAKTKRGKLLAQRSAQIYVGAAPAPQPVATVAVTPATATIEVGGAVQLTATVRDASGAELTGRTVTWSTSDAVNGPVSATGLVSGAGAALVTITATSEGKSGSATISVTAPAPPPPAGNPFVGAAFFVDPTSNARKQADAWRVTRPADAQQMEKVAAGAQADWFGDWTSDVRSAVDARVTQISGAGALPILVAYNIPIRDCNGYSGGGAKSVDGYQTWIRAFAEGIGTRRAVVVLEPDALAALDCLSPADQDIRLALIADAVRVLKARGAVSVYIDAGHPFWTSAATIAARLRAAAVAEADGFALNTSNFHNTADNVAYGDMVSDLIEGKRYVIDTSRNGLGATPDHQWCNPAGRALGVRPTASTGAARVDAFLWIKRPGESDGSCNGGPSAGQWWADYALGLAQRSDDGGASTFIAAR